MIFFILGFIGIIITIIILLIRVMKGKKGFNVLTIVILLLSITSLGIGIKFGLDDLNNNNNNIEDVSKPTNNKTTTKKSLPTDILDVNIQTLVEPKTKSEQVQANGYYAYSDELLEKLKKEKTEAYPQFGELKDEIKMRDFALVEYGDNRSIIRNRKDVSEVEGKNDLFRISDNIFDYASNTLYSFDENNRLISKLSKIDVTNNYINVFKNIRDKLIEYYGQPTFQNAFLTPKDKFDESKDKNITYLLRWDSGKKAVILMYKKNEKDNSKDSITVNYILTTA